MIALRAGVAMGALLLAASCGYHAAGHADLVPKTIHTIAIPAFGNVTTRFKLTDRLPEAIAREFIARTRYHIVADPNAADAILRGTVVNYTSGATVFDPVTGRAAEVDIHVYMQISLVERGTGKVLFSRPSMEVRDRYQVSTDPGAFFEESDTAAERASQLTARQVVSSILDNF